MKASDTVISERQSLREQSASFLKEAESTGSKKATALSSENKKLNKVVPVDSSEPRSSRSKSRTKRLGFDGAVETPHFTTSKNNLGERRHNSFAKMEEKRLTQGAHKSSIVNTTVEDSNKIPSIPGFDSPNHHTNHSQQDEKNNESANIDSVDNKVEMALGNSQIATYPGDEAITKSPSLDGADDRVESSRCTNRRNTILGAIICCAVIATSVIIPCIILLSSPSENNDFLQLSNAKRNAVVSRISVDICNEDVPKSGTCTPFDSNGEQQGGQLCNLVAKSMINTTVYGDIALINAGVCQDTLFSPEFTAGNIQDAIALERLMVVEMSGIDIVKILNEAIDVVFGETGNVQAYPYAAGLRYNVEANLPPSKRLSNIQVNRGLRDGAWESIDSRKFYKVVSTDFLANGGMGYVSFQNVIDDWKIPLGISTGDTFYDFAMKNIDTEWSILPNSEYSTQFFIGENEELAIATVPSRLCHALIPGKPDSSLCDSADVVHGGEVCNLVSWAIYDQNFAVDMVVLKGDTCVGDIEQGDFVESSFDSILPENQSLVTIDLLGSEIVTMIVENVSSAVTNDMPGNYPYAAGMRFDVSSISSPIVSSVQILTSGGSWIPISSTETYSVATTSEIAKSSSAQNMGTTIQEEIIDYAADWKKLYKIPKDKVSTQSFV